MQRETTVVRRRNMDGLKLKIMTVVTQKPHQPFELYLTTPHNTHLDSVHRYNYGLMSMLKDFYNFTFVNRRTKSWGYLRNGTFDGMIGALARREVDLGGSPMFFRTERHRVVSYTTRTFIERENEGKVPIRSRSGSASGNIKRYNTLSKMQYFRCFYQRAQNNIEKSGGNLFPYRWRCSRHRGTDRVAGNVPG
uniref:Ionotropic glutamate receptor L-glutamate and glycine-binding domain-containing protein n=1 Tax=Anopheles farauti TaxID=69004 RepID=A0A182QC33_9DIPT